MTYAEKLKDPRWQRKRLEILSRDNFTCCMCKDSESTLHVHHVKYSKNTDPWDYSGDKLQTLCNTCHEIQHKKPSILEQFLIKVILSDGVILQSDNPNIRADLRNIILKFLKHRSNG